MQTHACGKLTEKHLGVRVVLCGRVDSSRNLGGLWFMDVRDWTGIIQVNFEDFEGDMNLVKNCHLESVIKVEGVLRSRPVEAVNPNRPTGQVEVLASRLEILSPCNPDSLPFVPCGKIEATETLRLQYRYLDLRTPRLQNNLKIRSDTSLKVRQFLTEKGLIEVETPILCRSTPRGPGTFLFLAASMPTGPTPCPSLLKFLSNS